MNAFSKGDHVMISDRGTLCPFFNREPTMHLISVITMEATPHQKWLITKI